MGESSGEIKASLFRFFVCLDVILGQPWQVERIHKLELMDEFEEWHLIQGHYFVLCASRPETDLWVHNCTIFNKIPAEENWEGAGKGGANEPRGID